MRNCFHEGPLSHYLPARLLIKNAFYFSGSGLAGSFKLTKEYKEEKKQAAKILKQKESKSKLKPKEKESQAKDKEPVTKETKKSSSKASKEDKENEAPKAAKGKKPRAKTSKSDQDEEQVKEDKRKGTRKPPAGNHLCYNFLILAMNAVHFRQRNTFWT